MKCLNCGGGNFEDKRVRATPDIKGEAVEVVTQAFVCESCETPLMDDAQMNQLRRLAADKYRVDHKLLTSEEILKFRNMMGMSQIAFAHYLNVGEASIKRWETYFIQDPVQDEHIRLKCDEAYAEFNALAVLWKSHPPDIYSGNRRFSWELFKQVVRFLVTYAKSPLFLNKALFYADFIHFKRHGSSITGARYVHLEYGPCPDQYQNIFALLKQEGVLITAGHHELKSTFKADMDVFDDAEKETLESIAKLAKGQKLLKLSHEEEAFKQTEPLQFISYAFADQLLVE